MIVGFVLDDTLDSSDGVQQYVKSLGTWMTDQGHEVHYLVGQTEGTGIKNVHSLSKNLKVAFNHNKMTIPLPTNPQKIQKIIDDIAFDVLHVQMPHSPMMAAKIVKLASPGTALIGTFHILPFSVKEQTATRLLGRILRSNLKLFDKFISVSEPAKQFAKRSFNIDSVVISNVVSLPIVRNTANKSAADSDQLIIVFVGRLVPRKGVLQLIDAYKQLVDNNTSKKLHLRICGTGPLEKKVRTKIANYNLSDQVTLLGFVSENEKFNELASADIAVFPSLGGESFGIVLIEAMAAGAGVVVGGDNPGYRSVLEDESTLFDASKPTVLAANLSVLINDVSLRERLRKQQYQKVKIYDVNTVAPQIIKLYDAAIANKKNKSNNIEV